MTTGERRWDAGVSEANDQEVWGPSCHWAPGSCPGKGGNGEGSAATAGLRPLSSPRSSCGCGLPCRHGLLGSERPLPEFRPLHWYPPNVSSPHGAPLLTATVVLPPLSPSPASAVPRAAPQLVSLCGAGAARGPPASSWCGTRACSHHPTRLSAAHGCTLWPQPCTVTTLLWTRLVPLQIDWESLQSQAGGSH